MENVVGETEDNVDPFDPVTQDTDHATFARHGRPDPARIRGICPECGDDLVSNIYYVGGRGYLCVWECWGSLVENPGCAYRRVC